MCHDAGMVPADPQQLPDDIDALKAMIAAAHAEIAELKIINATADERIARLTSIVAMLQRAQYDTRSERLRLPAPTIRSGQRMRRLRPT